MDCPACGKTQEDGSAECKYCGIVFEKWRRLQAQPVVATGTVAATSSGSAEMWVGIIKVTLLAAAAGCGYWVYAHYFGPPSPAAQAYEDFADAWAKGDYGAVKPLAIGPALAKVEEELAPPPPPPPGLPGTLRGMFTAQSASRMSRSLANDLGGSIDKITYKIKSEQGSEAEVKISAVQRVRRLGTAAHSLLNPPVACFNQNAEMRRDNGTWKVYSFDTTFPYSCR